MMTQNWKNISNNHGFTLLEIIIAIGILAVMTLSMSEITGGIMDAKKRAEERNETRHGVVIAISKMSDDLRMAFQTDTKYFGAEQFYKTGFAGDKASLNFSTMSHVHFVKNRRDTDQVQVGYSLVDNEEGSQDLLRRQTDHLTDKLDSGGRSFALIRGVRDFELSYYDSNKKEWVDKWDTESVSAAGRLPQIVKVKLTVLGEIEPGEEEKRREYYYEFEVPIEMYAAKVSF